MEITGKNYIGTTLSSENSYTYRAYDPIKMEELSHEYYDATENEVNRTLKLAALGFESYRATGKDARAGFLEAIAEEIEKVGDQLVETAMQETGLPEGRLRGEQGRTTGQLRMFASLVREGSWVEASIDTAMPERQPVPKPDLRKMLVPIGPVVVFSASNFPFAFSVAGGDTASALAGGNPVIVKVHPGHPGTSEIVAFAISEALKRTGMPDGTFSMLHGSSYEAGKQLVIHPLTAAVGFTGSLQGGKALFDLAAKREKPIPVFAEMGSINPLFVLNDAMENRTEAIAGQLAGSINLGAGQFCTKPGLVVINKTAATEKFLGELTKSLSDQDSGTMLGKRIHDGYRKGLDGLRNKTGIKFLNDTENDDSLKGIPSLATVEASTFIKNPSLHEEVFGPFALVVICSTEDEMNTIAGTLEGQLTLTVIAEDEEFIQSETLISTLSQKAGRLIRNGVPTGVEVCPSMQHGGPYPATTDARFTSVGTAAIKRFVRPLAFQSWVDAVLPSELQNDNPLGIWRTVNGTFTNKPVGR